MDDATSYFIRLDEHRFRPTPLTGGAWKVSEQHISPMNGLIVHEIERFLRQRDANAHNTTQGGPQHGGDGLAIGRISVDILGVLTLDPFEVTVEVVRPGRTIELLEAVVISGGRPAVRARVWRSTVQDTEKVAGGEAEPLPGPDGLLGETLDQTWPGGYIRSLEMRPVVPREAGRTTAWVASLADLVEGEESSDLARLTGLVDTANGIAVRQSPEQWLYPNLDLTVHLLRRPEGRWLGLDTRVVFGPAGLGVTTSVLHDTAGHIGYANQTLTIRPRF